MSWFEHWNEDSKESTPLSHWDDDGEYNFELPLTSEEERKEFANRILEDLTKFINKIGDSQIK